MTATAPKSPHRAATCASTPATASTGPSKFAPLVRHIAALDLPPCLIDGEIVACGADGNPDFSSLQAVLKRGHGAQDEKTALHFFAFDLLEQNGKSLAKLGNLERKERLEALLRDASPRSRSPTMSSARVKSFMARCAARDRKASSRKRADAAYAGRRSKTG